MDLSDLSCAYAKIAKCTLVKNHTVTDESLAEFANLLNMSLPAYDDYQYAIVRGLYKANPFGFVKFIVGTEYECLILWTESKNIVKHYGISNSVYLRYNHKAGIYSADRKIVRGDTGIGLDSSAAGADVPIQIRDLGLGIVPKILTQTGLKHVESKTGV